QKTQGIGNVSRRHVLLIIKLIGKFDILDFFERPFGSVRGKIRIVTVCTAQDIFSAVFEYLAVTGTYGGNIIHLERKLLVVAGIFILRSAGDKVKILVKQAVYEIVGTVVSAVQAQDAKFPLWLFKCPGIVEIYIHVVGKVVRIHAPQQSIDEHILLVGFGQ